MEKIRVYGGQRVDGKVQISGAKNAALSAIAILALSDPGLKGKLKEFRAAQTRKVEEADAALQQELGLA